MADEVRDIEPNTVNSKPQRLRRDIGGRAPAIEPVMQLEALEMFDRQSFAPRQRLDRRVRAPVANRRRGTLRVVAALDAGEPFDRSFVLTCPEQLKKFGVRPHQWHSAARRFSRQQPTFGDWAPVPDLLGYEPARAGHTRNRFEVGKRVLTEQDIEVAAFAGEQRPRSANAVAI